MLISNYTKQSKITLEDIVEFHLRFERIHPFGDGNGRIGRAIMFKECLKNNIVPFIILDRDKPYYLRGKSSYIISRIRFIGGSFFKNFIHFNNHIFI